MRHFKRLSTTLAPELYALAQEKKLKFSDCLRLGIQLKTEKLENKTYENAILKQKIIKLTKVIDDLTQKIYYLEQKEGF